ncbi:MAG: hypothetical protein Q7S40_19565 [Opitutaceae bacterium]|nr:hypothetical protein [Opitutaceae bacterium]
MRWTRKKRLNSVLGLSLGHGQFRAFHVARAKRGVEVVRSGAATLTLDLLHPEAELIGREIKNHLEAAGIRERHGVVAVPAGWIMTQHTRLPELAPEDIDSFLQLEAEKGFPCDPAQLQIARSSHRSDESAYVTQLAVRREQVDHLAAALKSAGLKPLSFSLGLAALPGVITTGGRITLRLEPWGATLLISVGGGIAAFRTFDATINSEAGENVVNGAALAREVRITFEQVPSDLRTSLRELFITGDAGMAAQMAETLADWAADAALSIVLDEPANAGVADQMARQLAIQHLEAGASHLEFLPPKPGRWARLMARYNSKRLATVSFAAAAAALIAIGFFGWQEYRRLALRSQWQAMETQVTALETVQTRIRDYRPWYDTGFRNLSILKRVTECFPENGSVTAKSFEIHGATPLVTVSGVARDNAALLRTLDELRKTREVQALKIEQIRGKVPAQFTFTFRWNSNPGS